MSNLSKIQDFFAAYASKDVSAVKDALSEDIIWRIPGHHPLAGDKRGITEVLAFFDQLAKAGFQAQPIVVVEQGDFVVDHHRGWSTAGSGLDLMWCLVFRSRAGRSRKSPTSAKTSTGRISSSTKSTSSSRFRSAWPSFLDGDRHFGTGPVRLAARIRPLHE